MSPPRYYIVTTTGYNINPRTGHARGRHPGTSYTVIDGWLGKEHGTWRTEDYQGRSHAQRLAGAFHDAHRQLVRLRHHTRVAA
jgi:hypothetical protein